MADDLKTILRLYAELEKQRDRCEECEGEQAPEACGECMPYADRLRLAMRRASRTIRPNRHNRKPVTDGALYDIHVLLKGVAANILAYLGTPHGQPTREALMASVMEDLDATVSEWCGVSLTAALDAEEKGEKG